MMLYFAVNLIIISQFYVVWSLESEFRFSRLNNETRPLSYDLHIKTNIHKSEENFNGTIQIKLLGQVNTDRISMHAKDITVFKLNLVELDSEIEFSGLDYEINSDFEQITITSKPNPLEVKSGKKYLLTISYKGIVRRFKGFYLFFSKDSEGNSIPMGATHLSKGFARYLFPCYDEPAFKAKFTISITHAGNYTAFSNMPAIGVPIDSGEGLVTTNFMETPLMSTYIVAFVLGNYDNITETVGNTTLRLLYPPKSKGGQKSFDIAKKVLPLMNVYFEMAYPLPKMDHLSLTSFSARGMENWGLITYDETVLLDGFNLTKYEYLLNAHTVTHEIAHNWFGNLVSPAWWPYYWLSEGMASFYGPKFLEMVKPEWNIYEDITSHKFGNVIWDYPDRCSLTCHIETEMEFTSNFGPQSYGKAGFLMRMFENALTEDVFRRGIVKYLKRFQYSFATEDDLFTSLQEAVDESAISFFQDPGSLNMAMKSWTSKKFYPLITVSRDYDRGTFKIEQQNFKNRSSDNMDLWWIPISFTTKSSSDFENTTVDFIFPGDRSIEINPADFNKTLLATDWLVLNKEQYGMYRVNYDEKNWDLIICSLLKDPNAISRFTKTQILRDLDIYCQEDLVSDSKLINFLHHLKNESDPFQWSQALRVLKSYQFLLHEDESEPFFNNFVLDIIGKVFEELGIEEQDTDTPIIEILRPNIVKLACDIGLEKCVEALSNLLEMANNNQSQLSSKQISQIMEINSKLGNSTDYTLSEDDDKFDEFKKKRASLSELFKNNRFKNDLKCPT